MIPSPLSVNMEFFGKAAVAEGAALATYARSVDDLPRVSSKEVGLAGQMLIAAARALVRQLPEVVPETQVHLRAALTCTMTAIMSEAEAVGEADQPYYQRD